MHWKREKPEAIKILKSSLRMMTGTLTSGGGNAEEETSSRVIWKGWCSPWFLIRWDVNTERNKSVGIWISSSCVYITNDGVNKYSHYKWEDEQFFVVVVSDGLMYRVGGRRK